MLMESNMLFRAVYPEAKFWASIIGGLWMVFKAVNWFKSIKDNDLVHIQEGVNTIHTKLDIQTDAVVKELSEMRNDFRIYFAPPVSARARAKPYRK